LDEVPVITPGWAVVDRTASVLAVLVPQELEAVTETFPVANPAGKVTDTEVVP
jgi:hypothetical protein